MRRSFLKASHALPILLLAAGCPSFGADLLVSSTDNSIRRYDGATGAFKGYFVTQGAGGLNGPTNAIFGPDGNLYVGSIYTHSVKRYNGATGTYLDDFLPPGSGGGISPYDVKFGPDGNFYVASGWDYSPGSGHVKRFNGLTGAYIDDFVPSGSGGLDYAQGLIFGSDGNLYVADNAASAILRYNGTTGAFIGVFAPVGGDPTSLQFGPDGNLYVTLFYGHSIKRYNGATGADMGNFIPAGSGGLYWDVDLAFGPDGNLYEAERYSGSVNRFDGASGAPLGSFISGIPGDVLWLTWFPPVHLYNVCLLYDPAKAVKSGSTIPIKLQLCDNAGHDLSSSSITIHAISVTQVSTLTTGQVEDAGNANPDSDFRFDPTLGSAGGYIFNLKTTGLTTGTYNLNFNAGTDATVYQAQFQVR